MREVPEHFQAAVKAYDSALRVRWSQPLEAFVVERRIINSDPEMIGKLKGLMHARANREIMNGLPVKAVRTALVRRKHARSFLDGLNQGYRMIWRLDGVSDYDLMRLRFNLFNEDTWEKGQHDGNPAETAKRIAAKEDYNEEFEKRQRDAKRKDEWRDRGKQMYRDFKRRDDSAISVPG